MLDKTGHPCRLDFERFGNKIGLVKRRMDKILYKYMLLPEGAINLIAHKALNNAFNKAVHFISENGLISQYAS